MSAKAIKLELRRALPVILIGLAMGFISAVQMFYYLQARYNSFLANGPGVLRIRWRLRARRSWLFR